MRSEDYAKLLEDVEREILRGTRSVGILGLTTVTLRLLESLTPSGLVATIGGVYAAKSDGVAGIPLSVPSHPIEALAHNYHDVLVVAADEEKDEGCGSSGVTVPMGWARSGRWLVRRAWPGLGVIGVLVS